VRLLLVTTNVVPSSPIRVTLMVEALSSSGVTFQKTPFFIVTNVETSNLTRGRKFSSKQSLYALCFIVVPRSDYTLTLKMEAACSSETSLDSELTIQRYINI
jgi:hypothetical protein